MYHISIVICSSSLIVHSFVIILKSLLSYKFKLTFDKINILIHLKLIFFINIKVKPGINYDT